MKQDMVSTFIQNKHWTVAVCLGTYFVTVLQLQLVHCQTCNIVIRDELWSKQWYLNKTPEDNYDMNVLPAWRNCVNGTGVTVGVVDKGVQDHIDLKINRELNFGDSYSGEPNSYKHGTRAAGVIAALKNENFTVGIAFGAEIADIKIASTAVFETFNVSSFTHRMDIVDVYSCSFANFHTGTKIYPLLADQEQAFIRGTTQGRKGKGSVYVFATGNSGGSEDNVFTDHCAYDRLVTNRYVISVAGIQNDLSKIPNGEQCSAMMVAAFTAKAGAQHHKIVTTDIGNTSTLFFNQNSAAAPMVSGAVALALDANGNLTYRDVMHLLVQTSRSNLPEFQTGNLFTRNFANFTVSSYFGFGLLDIGKLVERSKIWKNVPVLKNCTSSVSPGGRPLNKTRHVVHIKSCDVTYAEHVEVSLHVKHSTAGQTQWTLISPYGTSSIILPGRGLDPSQNMSLTVLTVQLWGENPNGYWRLVPKAVFGRSLDGGILESFSITVHGFTCYPPDFSCLVSADQNPSEFTIPPQEVFTTESTPDTSPPGDDIDLIPILVPVFIVIVVVIVAAALYCAMKKKLLCFKQKERNLHLTDIL